MWLKIELISGPGNEARNEERRMATLSADRIVAALRGAFTHDASREELLRMAAERIHAAGPPYTSVYLYMLHGDELVLEAFHGRQTEHTRIPVGTGVCGTAVATGKDQNVGDVTAVGNYLACNLFTRSELVVLIRRGDLVLGQIDVDSDVPDPFSPAEHAEVRKVADALAVLL
jgi:L-methionine (R)-S-oxide reductase